MFYRRGAAKQTAAPVDTGAAPSDASRVETKTAMPVQDTGETRRAARTDLLGGIGNATQSNLTLGNILGDAFRLVDEMAAFSTEFDTTAETTRVRADRFVTSVHTLQTQGDIIETRLAGAADALVRAQERSRSALTSVRDLAQSIDDVERVIKMIAAIAAQTNLLALNATIEAARAGEAGAGFRVVAGEVKALAQQTQRATDEIVGSVKRIRERARINMAEVHEFDEAIGGIDDVFITVRSSVAAQGEQTRDIRVGSDELAALAQTVRFSAGRMRTLGGTVKSMTELADKAARAARHAFESLADRAAIVLRHGSGDEDQRTRRWPIVLPGTLTSAGRRIPIRVLDLSTEAMQIETGADFTPASHGETVDLDVEDIGRFNVRLLAPTTSGYETVLVDPSAKVVERITLKVEKLQLAYQPYISRVRATAARLGQVMEGAVKAGVISRSDLFDAHYQRDGKTEPAQYRNATTGVIEPCVQPILEEALAEAPVPDFCLLTDRNGFAAVHNLRYSQPARADDRLWNQRHSRVRRIFDDRAGMAAARSLQPFFVQSYARDMGDAVELRMEFDAPIFIHDHHWGAVRMAYKLA
jgi:methyl-accepting chemotaxis protein